MSESSEGTKEAGGGDGWQDEEWRDRGREGGKEGGEVRLRYLRERLERQQAPQGLGGGGVMWSLRSDNDAGWKDGDVTFSISLIVRRKRY